MFRSSVRSVGRPASHFTLHVVQDINQINPDKRMKVNTLSIVVEDVA
jgi:hypothetical protein